jgi:hypothetical protein
MSELPTEDHMPTWELLHILRSPPTGCRAVEIAVRERAVEEIERLTQELADRDEQHRRVMASPCPDEVHCTCVPILRREIERLGRCNEQMAKTHAEVFNANAYEYRKLKEEKQRLWERIATLETPDYYWDDRCLESAYEPCEIGDYDDVGDIIELRPIHELPKVFVLITEDGPQIFATREEAEGEINREPGEVEIRLDELPRRQPHITAMREEVSDES